MIDVTLRLGEGFEESRIWTEGALSIFWGRVEGDELAGEVDAAEVAQHLGPLEEGDLLGGGAQAAVHAAALLGGGGEGVVRILVMEH